jgi:hypothetical protein
MMRFACLAVVTVLSASLPAVAKDPAKIIGTIKAFECGDNCYLTIVAQNGKEIVGLCVAKKMR